MLWQCLDRWKLDLLVYILDKLEVAKNIELRIVQSTILESTIFSKSSIDLMDHGLIVHRSWDFETGSYANHGFNFMRRLTRFQKNPDFLFHLHFVLLRPIAIFPGSQRTMHVAPSHVAPATPTISLIRYESHNESSMSHRLTGRKSQCRT